MYTEYEIIVSSRSSVERSTKKFEVDVNQDETPDSTSIVTSLDDLSSMALYQYVTEG